MNAQRDDQLGKRLSELRQMFAPVRLQVERGVASKVLVQQGDVPKT